jgi:hypothetical protein
MTPISNAAVAAVYDGYPNNIRAKMLALRALVLETAARTNGVGALEETLKWGEPAYLTTESRSGSTVRIAWKRSAPQEYALYFNCRTTLVDSFRAMFPQQFRFDGNRALVFREDDDLPVDALRSCIEAALTYHRRAKHAW